MQIGGFADAKQPGQEAKYQRYQRLRFSLLVLASLCLVGFLSGCSGLVNATKTTLQAVFQLNPSSINFGKVGVGKQGIQVVSVTNTGNTSISITQATFSNPQFSLSGAAFPMAMATGQASNLTVAVSPTAAGNVTGTMTVQGSDGSSPQTVNLTATAVTAGPQISLNSTSVQFGTVSVGSTGSASLTISNAGSSDLTVSMLSVTGSDFGVGGITTPKTISTGQSVLLSLSFHPTSSGSTSGTLTITSNDPTNPTMTVNLAGTGSNSPVGQLQASAASLAFGTVSTGTSSTQHVTLTNTGTAAVQISPITSGNAGFSVNGFTVPLTLNPSASVTLNVVFSPTAAGSVTGNITITSNANNSPLLIPISGTGTQGGLSIAPSSFAFGSVVDGQTKSQTFRLTNTGTASVAISQLSASGTGFSVSGLTTPATLAVGASANFNAIFAPSTAGNFSGSVSVTSNAPNSPETVALSGTGVASSVGLSANPSSLSFGSVNAGNSSTKGVTLTNTGNSNLTISQVAVGAKDVTEGGLSLPVTVAPGTSRTMNVTFSPAAAETVSGNITVTNSQGGSILVPVSGTGLQAGITLTPASANFVSVAVGSTNSQTIRISNPGNAVLTITQANISGTGFSTSGLNLPLSVNPGQSSTFNAEFQPAATGTTSGSISLVSNAPGSPSVLSLSGSAVAATQTLSFSTSAMSFGGVDTGLSSMQTETVTNTGNSNVQISQITVSGTGFSLSGAATPVTLTPSQRLIFNVTFSPAAAGGVSGSVTVTSNATGSPATITLSGTGVQSVPHTVSLTWTASTSTVVGYNVYRTTTSGSGYSKVNSALVSVVNYTDSTVSNGTTYYYVTTAVDGSGNESGYSNEAAAVIP